MRSIILMGLALAASAGAAPPREDWVIVGRFADGGPVEVDRAALYTSRGLTQVPWRIAFGRPRPDGAVYEGHVMLVDCQQAVTAGVSTTLLGEDGRVISHRADPQRIAEQRLGPPTPGSTGETVAIAACGMLPPDRR